MILTDDCMNGLKKFPDMYFDLIIADPPYFKVINAKWDYQWRTEEDYINWSIQWISEVYRTLRYGGTFYIFGYFKMLSLILPHMLNMGFKLRQQIIINKGVKSIAGRATKNYKMFPTTTESLLFMVKDNIQYSRYILKEQQEKCNLTSKQINEALGVKSNGGGMWSIYTGKNVCEQFPTKKVWCKLQSILNFNISYEKIAQTFHSEMGITDVWSDVDFYHETRYHPTQKPIKLAERLIRASSNNNDNILDLFGGSGNFYITALNLNRNAVVIEKDNFYTDIIKQRMMYNGK